MLSIKRLVEEFISLVSSCFVGVVEDDEAFFC